MRKAVLALMMSVLVADIAFASTPTQSVGPFGPPNPVAGGRDVCFSLPGDLNGIIETSEIISQFGLETRLANSFSVTTDTNICLARWWGGYYNNTNCSDNEVTTFNLYFYDDLDCLPHGDPIGTFVVNPTITFLVCQAGAYPIYQYEASISQPVQANRTYWFVAQATDHAYPPQWGRLVAPWDQWGPCGTPAFWSPYFGYPDWTWPDCHIFQPCPDASAEFECCQPTPVKEGTWGRIKSLYR